MTDDAPTGPDVDGDGRWAARSSARDAAAGAERVATWAEETRRYRRSPGGWWWLALLLIPALLAALGASLGDDTRALTPVPAGGSVSASTQQSAGTPSAANAPATTAGSASATSSAAESASVSATTSPTASSTSSASNGASGSGGGGSVSSGVFSISRGGDEVTVAADVPDEAGHTALVEAVRAAVGDAKIVDNVKVVPGASAAKASSVAAALEAMTGAGDFGLAWDLKSLTAVGTVDSEASKASIGAALANAWPDVSVQNGVTVGGDPAGCANLGDRIRVALASTKITFERDSTAVRPAGVEVVEEVAGMIQDCAESAVTVTGYTDASGSKAENLALSKARANSVSKILTANGVAAERVTTKGRADADPVADDDAPGGREANRRVEITVN